MRNNHYCINNNDNSIKNNNSTIDDKMIIVIDITVIEIWQNMTLLQGNMRLFTLKKYTSELCMCFQKHISRLANNLTYSFFAKI